MRRCVVMKRILLIVYISIKAHVWTVAGNVTFPIEEFLNITNLDDGQLLYLQETYLCNTPGFEKCCSCSPECLTTGFCCIDYFWRSEYTKDFLHEYLDQFFSRTEQNKNARCSPIMPNLAGKHTSMKVYMVSMCPKGSLASERLFCEEGSREPIQFNLLPVVGSDNMLYRNRYCAFCNGVNSFEALNLSATCEEPTNRSNAASILDAYSLCSFQLVNRAANPVSIITCDDIPDIFRFCPLEEQSSLKCKLCQAYGGVTYKKQLFKNFHCQKILYPTDPFELSLLNRCTDAFVIPLINKGIPLLPTYSMIISFAPESDQSWSSREVCSVPSVFDAIAGKCVEPVCSAGYDLRGIECVKSGQVSNLNTRKSVLVVDGLSVEENCLLSQAAAVYIELLLKSNANVTQEVEEFTLWLVTAKFISTSASCTLLKLETSDNISKAVLQVRTLPPEAASEVLDKWKKAVHLMVGFDFTVYISSAVNGTVTDYYKFSPKRSFPFGRTCLTYREHNLFNISVSCQLHVGGETFDSSAFILLASMSKSDLGMNMTAITCSKFYSQLSCHMRTISAYTFNDDMTVMEHESRKVYDFSEYSLLETGVGVCVKVSKNKTKWMANLEVLEGILTVIGTLLSAIAYSWTILTYALIRELRNVSGKNLICICFMLLLSDALLLSTLLARRHEHACQAVAILMHWSLLAVQLWTAVIAFDVWSTFQGTSLKRVGSSNKRFVLYCLFAWGLATLVVGGSAMLDAANAVVMGYGKLRICWINNQNGRLATFIFPFIMSLVFATVTLTYTIYRIVRHSKKSKRLLKKTGGENLNFARIALKLVFLLGIIEILGLVQFISSNDVLLILNAFFRLVYASLRSFRGVFVWLLYVATDRLFTVCKRVRQRSSSSAYSSQRHGRSYKAPAGVTLEDDTTAITEA